MDKKRREHKFLNKHPWIGSVLVGLLVYAGVTIVVGLINYPLSMLVKGYDASTGFIGVIIGAVVTTFAYKKWFEPEFKGFTYGSDIGAGIRIGIPYYIYWVISVLVTILFTESKFQLASLTAVQAAFSAGCLEEVIFRGGVLNTMLRGRKKQGDAIKALVISSVIFGLVHLANLSSGANAARTVIQVFTASGIGFVNGVIYLVSGNLLLVIILHTIHDIIALSFTGVTEAGVITAGVTWDIWLDLLLCVALAVYAIVMLRRGDVYRKIENMWDQKWDVRK
ncbi:MAG: type II CAAX endopeptidase family protein [Lachnospiraceae bacterium]|nr:type II CAAX endopeptidase family protein [Lachnospiraceae bacterium]